MRPTDGGTRCRVDFDDEPRDLPAEPDTLTPTRATLLDRRLLTTANVMGSAFASFGGGLNLNIHVHALVPDGVFVAEPAGAAGFHAASPLTHLDVEEVLATVDSGVRRLLARRGLRSSPSTYRTPCGSR